MWVAKSFWLGNLDEKFLQLPRFLSTISTYLDVTHHRWRISHMILRRIQHYCQNAYSKLLVVSRLFNVNEMAMVVFLQRWNGNGVWKFPLSSVLKSLFLLSVVWTADVPICVIAVRCVNVVLWMFVFLCECVCCVNVVLWMFIVWMYIVYFKINFVCSLLSWEPMCCLLCECCCCENVYYIYFKNFVCSLLSGDPAWCRSVWWGRSPQSKHRNGLQRPLMIMIIRCASIS